MPIKSVVLALLIANGALAQERPFATAVPDVRPRMHVRAMLSRDNQWQVGYVESVDSTTLALTLPGSYASRVQLDIPLKDLIALERGVARGKVGYGFVGLLAGFSGGAIIGGTAGAVFGQSNPEDGKFQAVAGGLFIGSIVGSLFGAAIGVDRAPVEWIPVKAR